MPMDNDKKMDELRTLTAWLYELIRQYNDPSNSGGSGSGTSGKNGKSLEFTWQGTKLGVRVEGETSYNFVDLKGSEGKTPHIDPETGHWFIGSIDTNISAEGVRGPDGKTPNLTIGTVETVPSNQSASASITGTSPDLQLNLQIPAGQKGDASTNTDEKVKMNSSSAQAKYLAEHLDGTTLVVDAGTNKMKVVTLDGLQTTVTTLNFLQSLDKDIMTYLSAIANPMSFRAVVQDDETLASFPSPQVGDTFIVKTSASNDNKTMTFIYDGITHTPIAETSIEVRDLSVDKLNLANEITGILSESHIDSSIARTQNVLDKTTYEGSAPGTVTKADSLTGLSHSGSEVEGLFENDHTHENKSLLDALTTAGDGKLFLTNKGTYTGIFEIGSSAPDKTGILWIDDSVETKPVMKFHNGTEWVPISSSMDDIPKISVDSEMSDTSENPIQNKAVKAYVDEKETKISEDADNAIVNHEDGIYVSDKSDELSSVWTELGMMNRAKKWVNSDTESAFISIFSPSYIVANQHISMTKLSGSMTVEDNKIFLKKGKRYEFVINLKYVDTTKNVYSSIVLNLVDLTNDYTIGSAQGYYNGSFELSFGDSYQYTASSDCQVALIARSVYQTDILATTSTLTVHEISRSIEIDPVDYVNTESGIEDTPVGTIIPVMANNPPAHYLVCDGAVYTIGNYPFLAQHIKDEFGSYDHFGGDGTTTFAVPDLRGEFLRGTGTSPGRDYMGGDVGVHQEPTHFPYFGTRGTSGNGVIWFDRLVKSGNYNVYPQECDFINMEYTPNMSLRREYGVTLTGQTMTWSNSEQALYSYFISRPANTSILYCIKAEPTYFMKIEGKDCYSYNKHLVGYWVDNKPLYEKTFKLPPIVNTNTIIYYAHGIENVHTIMVASGYLINPETGVALNIPYTNANQAFNGTTVWVNRENIALRTEDSREGFDIYLNLRWTET